MNRKPVYRSTHPEVFLGKGALEICSKFTGEHPRRSVISIKLQSNFIKITLRHGCCSVNLLHIFRIPFLSNTCGCLLLCLVNLLSDKQIERLMMIPLNSVWLTKVMCYHVITASLLWATFDSGAWSIVYCLLSTSS